MSDIVDDYIVSDTEQRFIARGTGKLLCARVFSLKSHTDVDDYANAIGNLLAKTRGAPVLVADHRPVYIYPQEVADTLAALFMQMNTRLVRVAILAARSNATLVLQLERLVREAAYEHRRVFHSPDDAIKHITPALDTHEIAEARTFLAQWRPQS